MPKGKVHTNSNVSSTSKAKTLACEPPKEQLASPLGHISYGGSSSSSQLHVEVRASNHIFPQKRDRQVEAGGGAHSKAPKLNDQMFSNKQPVASEGNLPEHRDNHTFPMDPGLQKHQGLKPKGEVDTSDSNILNKVAEAHIQGHIKTAIFPKKRERQPAAEEEAVTKLPKVINLLSSANRHIDHNPHSNHLPQNEVKPSFSAAMRMRALKRKLNEAMASDSQSKRPRGDQSPNASFSSISPVSGRPPDNGEHS